MSMTGGNNEIKEFIRRYPGPRFFDDQGIDEYLFFGRDKEITALSNRMQARRTMVLFGRSGLGKTSLIKAGLFPAMRRLGYLPIYIRLNDPEVDLQALILHAIEEAVRRDRVDVQIVPGASLWEIFKQTDFWREDQLWIPLLVFDQFEEIFTLHEATYRDDLVKQLKELAGDAIPTSVRQARAEGQKINYSLDPPDLRLLFSLREEYVGSLETFVEEVPTLLEHRYQLNPLQTEQAKRAIIEPAKYNSVEDADLFATTPFTFKKSAWQLILSQLENRHGEIEPFQLQLLCQHAENRVIRSRAERNQPVELSSTMLGGAKALERVRSGFYQKALREVSGWWQRRRARRLCERLLNAEERRISMDGYTVRRKLHVNPSTLKRLEDSRLLRKDARPGLDGFYYELSHDSVARAVAKSRRKRRWVRRGIYAVVFLSMILYFFMLNLQVGEQKQIAQGRLDDYGAVVVELYAKEGALLPDLVEIKPVCFLMGSKKGHEDELPQHKVCIGESFHLGQHEVTFNEYDRFAAATGRSLPEDYGWGRGRRPVVDVNWNDARAFADWIGSEGDNHCRLPSEAEWEYAARAGTSSEYALPVKQGSDDISDKGLANCDGCGSEWGGEKTAPVKAFPANTWGLHDMHGNVWEWTEDCWHENYNKAPADGSAWLNEDGGDCGKRVLRGGSWGSLPGFARSAVRGGSGPDGQGGSVGFRVLCSGPFKSTERAAVGRPH
ncbi:MAG: formylglycine-generating enzyme family protein [Candidatus Thiodiazotropha sp.]